MIYKYVQGRIQGGGGGGGGVLMPSAYTLLTSFASELPLFWMEGISWKDCTRKLLVPALALTIDSTYSAILSG